MSNPLGSRILIWGSSCSGKSTLARQLADHFDYPCVDLDALNWMPGWVGLNSTDPARLEARMREATAGEEWVVAGAYTQFAQKTFWPRLQTVIFLDLPLWVLMYRVVIRTWRRSQRRELLWGTNYESFWKLLKVWRPEDSLLAWIVRYYHRRRRQTLDFIIDPRWAHIHFIHIRSPAQVQAMLADLQKLSVKQQRQVDGPS